ncbi:hypothetical protein AN189_00645 [Loktanella sp. 3ANDIMAR09]|uniref:flagellin n=1 Tax=Loktanella sp. 3ANDIMAR09 TaxID=1225657 RepID=UPI0006F9EC66|nr:flagellin [Loktanella sp. 3ANDIMAR09]KQI69955.1 hypothetical protein AN189_00645 [Loktanella sp. 3ANDIMAR09]
MNGLSIGDRAQAFQSLRNGQTLKSNLDRLAQELSTGRPADMVQHLSGRTSELATLSGDIETIDAFLAASSAFDLELTRKQAVLEAVANPAIELGARWLTVTSTTPQSQIVRAEADGRALLGQAISQINERVGGRSLFAGAAVDRTPLADVERLLSELDTVVAGLTDPAGITAAIDQWFSDPVAGYSAVIYGGDAGPPVMRSVNSGENIPVPGRADDLALRDTLAAVATVAMGGRIADRLTVETRADLLRRAGADLMPAANGLIALAGDIGAIQARLDASVTYQSAQRTAFEMARNTIVQADPFQTATALQTAQQQLELHYTATARLSRLSLATYL